MSQIKPARYPPHDKEKQPMPLTAKGQKILEGMKEQYGAEKGEQVFYASKNKGTITGVDSKDAVIPVSYVPQRQNLIGNIPTEEGGFSPEQKAGEALTPTVAPITGLTAKQGNTVVGSSNPPRDRNVIPSVGDRGVMDSRPVGDQSMRNWNTRNKAFYAKRIR